jgi:hypothetical protein
MKPKEGAILLHALFFTHRVGSGQRKYTHNKGCFKMALALLRQHLVEQRNEQNLSQKTSARHIINPKTSVTQT